MSGLAPRAQSGDDVFVVWRLHAAAPDPVPMDRMFRCRAPLDTEPVLDGAGLGLDGAPAHRVAGPATGNARAALVADIRCCGGGDVARPAGGW